MDLAGALAPVAARLIAQFSGGARIRLRASAKQRQPDGSSVPQWGDVAAMTAAPVLIEELGAERALKLWGAEKTVQLQGTVAIPVGVPVPEPVSLAVRLTGGLRGGNWLVVGVKADATSRTALLALQATRDTLGLP